MGNFKFEEYRQPWETGPHWELKREFMEKYQNDFPEDRLLCLAQAYSNMELLHCSYPDPVMLQINELSKPLKGCKRFREAKKNFAKNEELELQARSGKRSALDDSTKPFKFIKFCSAGNQYSQATDNSASEDKILSVISEKTDISSKDPLAVKVSSSLVSSSINPLNDPSSIKLSSSLEFSASVSASDIPSQVGEENTTFSSKCSCSINNNFILSIVQSLHFNLLSQISEKITKSHIKSRTALEVIDVVAEQLNAEELVSYKFSNQIIEDKPVYVCKFYIGDTLISTGRDSSERLAQSKAAEYAMEVLMNLPRLPNKALYDLKGTTDDMEVGFFQNFAQEVAKLKAKAQNPYLIIQNLCAKLTSASELVFLNVSEDPDTPLHSRIFYCDLVIKKILICTGKGSSKKKAKSEAAELGILSIADFINELHEGTEGEISNKSNHKCPHKDHTASILKSAYSRKPHKKSNTQLHREDIISNFKLSSKTAPETPELLTMESELSIVECPDLKTNSFKINHRLLNNSLQKKLVIFDSSDIRSGYQQTPAAILNYAAQLCHKTLSYEMIDHGPTLDGPLYRCNVICGGEIVGVGSGPSKNDAKTIATFCTLEKLQKEVYTIKVKSELDEGFVISRDQIISADFSANTVSDSNIGCKMMKMMGWSGGGIGKTGGITEPIIASEHRFHQGLGFSNGGGGIKQFKQKIEALIKDFSQSNTTSDLIFSTDFSKEERKDIHKIAMKFGLNSTSRGKGQQRQLFVRRKITVTELLEHLVNAGGCTPKYELVDKSS